MILIILCFWYVTCFLYALDVYISCEQSILNNFSSVLLAVYTHTHTHFLFHPWFIKKNTDLSL